jgi:hypothetical protein
MYKCHVHTREKYNVFGAGLKFDRKAKTRFSNWPVTQRTDMLSPKTNMMVSAVYSNTNLLIFCFLITQQNKMVMH